MPGWKSTNGFKAIDDGQFAKGSLSHFIMKSTFDYYVNIAFSHIAA